MDQPKESEVLTTAELAEYRRVHPTTIYRLLKARKLPAFKNGSDWRFNRERIDEWRRALEQSSGTETPSAKRREKDAPPTGPRARLR